MDVLVLLAQGWTMREVAERWTQLYKAPILVQRWLDSPATVGKVQLATVTEIVEVWRKRLHDISWFMRGVNETIARMANNEEDVKGRFWGRKSLLHFLHILHPCKKGSIQKPGLAR